MDKATAQKNKLIPYNGTCRACGEENAKMYKCAVCLITRYCSSECQKFDWKTHKMTCKAIDRDNPKVKLSKISLELLTEIAIVTYIMYDVKFDIKPICCIKFTDNSFRQLERGISVDKIISGCTCNWLSKKTYVIMHNDNLPSFTVDNIGIAIFYGGESIFYSISKVAFMIEIDSIIGK